MALAFGTYAPAFGGAIDQGTPRRPRRTLQAIDRRDHQESGSAPARIPRVGFDFSLANRSVNPLVNAANRSQRT